MKEILKVRIHAASLGINMAIYWSAPYFDKDGDLVVDCNSVEKQIVIAG